MGHIRAVPELHLILNPSTGVIAEEREDVVEYSLDAVKTQLDELDNIVTDMMNQLSPTSPLLSMFPGRERASYNAGIVTNAFYGAVVGFIITFLLLILLKIGGI
ncbi:tetrahydromethanopterin S-methyltransferase, subunit B [Candidatus Methanoperedens nitroreducens]|uniref:Tetrahydromethanopterin S-methyltransferase subunit B n=1 Tax=Candidatus Methanoperedens nitratireducens TaxID=1392998 RepID=A0A062VE35_9EURY|nr:tetrahydromethanopterin S-methyltransferase subunit B [Candidatus Methanoperedens nitroreducens]KCZ73425.1 tetrahydromethanopterin S-methyltransferase, subunit B [Candidatus Methanoperedens nitroreducens]MDJ1422620.1 tetrahydromethanopterin S-methyltransferase subunit B [Candidatus Methanoperedens sp.]